MPFYDHGRYAGEDAEEVNFDMSEESRQILIFEYIYQTYSLIELANELSVGTLGTDRRHLAIDALEYIRDHTGNGCRPDFGGYTWSDDDVGGSDNRRPSSASGSKGSVSVRPAKASGTRKSRTPSKTNARTSRRYRSWRRNGTPTTPRGSSW